MDDLALTGPTLRVRIPREEDAAALFEQASDPEVTRWFSWGPYSSEAEARSYLARLPAQRTRGEHFDLVVEHLEAGPIGITGLGELAVRDRRAVIGTWLGRRWWGTGANEEAKALMCHLAFVLLGLDRLGAYSNVHHERSQRALERIGFRREGVLRGYHRHGDRALDVVVFALLRGEWEAGGLFALPVTVTGTPPPTFVVGG
ncbi:MAG TPA: GNAT family N-acetyltransferase [Solirubrobacteraceae bacterium]|nr:GNAT family N-acetyltransferase [Solirubrobacteraceae bacterium]